MSMERLPTRIFLRRIRLMLSTACSAAPWLVALGGTILVLGSILQPLAVAGVGLVVTALTSGDHASLTTGLVLVCAGLVSGSLQSLAHWWCWSYAEELTSRQLRHRLLRTVTAIPTLDHLDDPEVSDLISDLHRRTPSLARSANSLLQVAGAAAQTGATAVVLFHISGWLVLLLPLALIPSYAAARTGRVRYTAEKAGIEEHRVADRLFDLTRDPGIAIELRCSGIVPELLATQRDRLGSRIDRVVATGRRTRGFDIGARVGWVLVLVTAVLWVFSQVRTGALGIGALLTLVLLIPGLEDMVYSLTYWANFLSRLYQTVSGLDTVLEYTADQRVGTAAAPSSIRTGIALQDTRFRYARAQQDALAGVDLMLQPGSVIALVGENGAGKSTLVALLCGLYRPVSGSITVDGADLAEIDPAAWARQLSGAFQAHADLEFTVREGIAVADESADDERIRLALQRARATELVAELPHGLATQLGRQFTDGTDLSGGQWQRLAIARGVLRERPLLRVFDEPTSALDADAEDAILTEYLAAARRHAVASGGISLLVSHRMSTVRSADRILVMVDGRITEDGTHDELIAAGSSYAELFDLQARHYR
ncbi:MAG: ABC transporter ATP-binding protein [Nakamurella sp.]